MSQKLTLNALLWNQDILQEQLRVHIEEVAKQREHLESIRKQASERVKNGETTGDELRDAVIVAYGRLVLEAEEFLLDIGAKIAGHKGDPVLRVSYSGSTDKVSLYLGVLNGDYFVVDLQKGTCAIPVSKTAHVEDLWGHSPGYRALRPHEVSNLLSQEWDTEKYVPREEVHVGLKSILTWAREQEEGEKVFHLLYLMSKEIDFELPEIPELPEEMRKSLDSILDGSVKAWGEHHPHVD